MKKSWVWVVMVGGIVIGAIACMVFCVCHRMPSGLKEGHGGGGGGHSGGGGMHGGGHGFSPGWGGGHRGGGHLLAPGTRGGYGGDHYAPFWGSYGWWYDPYYYTDVAYPPEDSCGASCLDSYKKCVDSGGGKKDCSVALGSCVGGCF